MAKDLLVTFHGPGILVKEAMTQLEQNAQAKGLEPSKFLKSPSTKSLKE